MSKFVEGGMEAKLWVIHGCYWVVAFVREYKGGWFVETSWCWCSCFDEQEYWVIRQDSAVDDKRKGI